MNAIVAPIQVTDLVDPEELAQQDNSDNRKLSPIEQRALKLLGTGQNQKIVAGVLGVSEGRISQLMSESWFAAKVSDLRYSQATQARELDEGYDNMEVKLQAKLAKQIPLMFKSQEILKALQVINLAKRKLPPVIADREENLAGAQVISLTIPTQIINKFTVNVNNQVVEVDGQSLVTATPGMLNKQEPEKAKELSHESSKSEQVAIADSSLISSQAEVLQPGRVIRAEDII